MGDLPAAVVLLSGGLDSAVTLALARRDGFSVHALSFAYGQRHAAELDAARRVAERGGAASHRVLRLDLGSLGGSALTDPAIEVPRARADAEIGRGIPSTYVPARNAVFLAHAAALAEVLGSRDVFLGVNHLDSSGYPDCRPEFLAAFEEALRLGTRAGSEGAPLRLRAPLAALGKREIVLLGRELGVDFALTRSCYAPDAGGSACGACDACRLRLRGFAQAGLADPAPYRDGIERPDVAAARTLGLA